MLPSSAHGRVGQTRSDSDIDIMIEIAPDTPIGLFEYVAITQFFADQFPSRIDLANRDKLKPLLRPSRA